MLTKQDLEEIKTRADKARQGPWVHFPWSAHDSCSIVRVDNYLSWRSPGGSVRRDQDEADADFITWARMDVPALLEHIEKMERVVNAARSYSRCAAEFEDPKYCGEWLAALWDAVDLYDKLCQPETVT